MNSHYEKNYNQILDLIKNDKVYLSFLFILCYPKKVSVNLLVMECHISHILTMFKFIYF